MTGKKQILKSLSIYIVITFFVTYSIQLVFFKHHAYYDAQGTITDETSLILAMSMLIPTLGMLLARWINKEGFALTGKDSMLLGISFKDKKWIFFILSLIIPWFIHEMGGLLEIIVFQDCFDINSMDEAYRKIIFVIPFWGFVSGTLGSFGGLGEELGWRGYMMPRLQKILGVRWAVIVGGIIWGVWHYVAIAYGHNFGLDYIGAPYSGMFVFTLFVICENAFLTYLTQKSESIWPAAFAHATNNAQAAILPMMINWEKLPELERTFVLLGSVPMVVLGIVCMILLKSENTNMFEKN